MEENVVEKIRKTLTESHSMDIHGNMIHLEIFQKDKTVFMNIYEQDEWADIKSSIDVHLSQVLTRQCPLCLITDTKKFMRISCPKCAFYWCNGCYMKMIRKKCFHEEISCPSCGDSCIDKKTCFMEME